MSSTLGLDFWSYRKHFGVKHIDIVGEQKENILVYFR